MLYCCIVLVGRMADVNVCSDGADFYSRGEFCFRHEIYLSLGRH